MTDQPIATAFVLIVDHDGQHPDVSVHQTLGEAQAELRSYAQARFGAEIPDDEILDLLLQRRMDACVHIVTTERGEQTSETTTPFFGCATEAA